MKYPAFSTVLMASVNIIPSTFLLLLPVSCHKIHLEHSPQHSTGPRTVSVPRAGGLWTSSPTEALPECTRASGHLLTAGTQGEQVVGVHLPHRPRGPPILFVVSKPLRQMVSVFNFMENSRIL